jgi:hypothetical protein
MKLCSILILLLAVCISPSLGQVEDIEIAFCQFDVAENIRGGHASYSIRYAFEVDTDGKAAKLEDLSKLGDSFAEKSSVENCLRSWRFPKSLTGKRASAHFRWEHSKGWTGLTVVSGLFRYVIRIEGSRCPYPPSTKATAS